MEEFEYTNRLKLPLLVPNQSGKEIFHNEAIITLDNIIQNCILDKDLATPPENPNSGDIYIIANNATDEWLNKDNNIAFYDNGWRFLEQKEGFTFFIKDECCFYSYIQNEWIKTENIINLNNLKNVNFNNLSNNDIIVFDGEKFINKQDLILNSITLKDNIKIESDDNNNLSIKYNNNETWNETININKDTGIVNFKNSLYVNNKNIQDLLGNNITIDDLNLKLNTDFSNITIDSKNIINNMVYPDYSAGIQLVFLQKNTITDDGWVEISGIAYYGTHLQIKINEIQKTIATSANSNYSCTGFLLIPVKKGDIIEGIKVYNNTGKIIFYPNINNVNN